jgi:uncharacterized protein (DUF305 family)
MKHVPVPAALLLTTVACSPGAQPAADPSPSAAGDHSGHQAKGAADQNPSTRAFQEANERMHRDMAIAYTGDADADFMAAMVPHHEGAVTMARVELAHGKDSGARALAEAVIAAQEAEIAQIKAWQARRAGRADNADR